MEVLALLTFKFLAVVKFQYQFQDVYEGVLHPFGIVTTLLYCWSIGLFYTFLTPMRKN
jgi:hypothetical protein